MHRLGSVFGKAVAKRYKTKRLKVTNRKTHFAYNQRKRQALGIFERRGWLNPAAWAVLAGVYPTRSAYSYLRNLHRWGLLARKHDARGLLAYRLSAKGARRLAWLRRSMGRGAA